MAFFLLQNWRLGGSDQVLSGGWYQWDGGGCDERVKEGKYVENTVYTCM
jgi:hypothetical protein